MQSRARKRHAGPHFRFQGLTRLKVHFYPYPPLHKVQSLFAVNADRYFNKWFQPIVLFFVIIC